MMPEVNTVLRSSDFIHNIFLVQYDLDKSAIQPKCDLTGVRTMYDLQIMTLFVSRRYPCSLITRSSGTSYSFVCLIMFQEGWVGSVPCVGSVVCMVVHGLIAFEQFTYFVHEMGVFPSYFFKMNLFVYICNKDERHCDQILYTSNKYVCFYRRK